MHICMNVVSFTRIATIIKASKTKIAAALFLIVLGIVLFPGKKLNAAEEQSGNCGDNVTWTLDAEGTLIISGSGATKDYNKGSDSSPFNSKTEIKKVVIESGVTSIGSALFYNCSKLTEVSISDGVTSIGNNAFEQCTKIINITLPDSVTSVNDSAFANCTELRNLTLSNSLTSIGQSAFYGCNNIFRITLPNSVTSIGQSAFRGCSSLSGIIFPNSVTSIGINAFVDCNKLGSITIRKSLYDQCLDAFTGISSDKFHFYDLSGSCGADGDNVTWTLDDEGMLTIFGTGATTDKSPFYNHPYIKKVVIESGVTSIGSSLFSDCSNITEVSMADSVTSIGNSAFQDCLCLSSITLSNNLTSIGNKAFYMCRLNLTSITIPNSVTSIGEEAFDACVSLKSVKLPDSLTSISNYTFENCTNLENITIPNNVTSIGKSAFCGCKGLTSITIPNSVTSIGNFAFDRCENVTNITIPNSVTSIGRYAFEFCTSLTNITIPNSVTSIGTDVFYQCTSLTSITIKNSLYEQSNDAFLGISSDKFHFYYDLKYTTDGNGSVTGPSETFDSSAETLTMSPGTDYATDKVTWSDGSGEPVELKAVNGKYTMPKPSDSFDYESGTVTVSVTFRNVNHEITFKNYDGTVLEKKKVPEGETPEYTGTIFPSKPSAGGYSYEFEGWDTAPVAVTGPATYTATYTRKEIEYKVTFVDDDGVEICSDTVKYHEVTVFNGNTTPVRKETDTHKFTFTGWTDGKTTYSLDQGLPQIESDTTFSPVFDPVVKPVYTVGEVKGDGINSDIVIDVHRNVDDENCLTYFLGATIDGTEMKANDQYTATKGSTIITIKKDFLSTLSAGEHEVTVNFNDGSISTKVTIAAKANTNTSVPSTGEVTGPAAYIGLAFVADACACGAGIVLLKKRKEA